MRHASFFLLKHQKSLDKMSGVDEAMLDEGRKIIEEEDFTGTNDEER
jgi:hypothetical protein